VITANFERSRTALGADVGDPVGAAVGADVGDPVGAAVGADVGDPVGASGTSNHVLHPRVVRLPELVEVASDIVTTLSFIQHPLGPDWHDAKLWHA